MTTPSPAALALARKLIPLRFSIHEWELRDIALQLDRFAAERAAQLAQALRECRRHALALESCKAYEIANAALKEADGIVMKGSWENCSFCGGVGELKEETKGDPTCPQCGGRGGWMCRPKSDAAMKASGNPTG